jgi:hypothetical protein
MIAVVITFAITEIIHSGMGERNFIQLVTMTTSSR